MNCNTKTESTKGVLKRHYGKLAGAACLAVSAAMMAFSGSAHAQKKIELTFSTYLPPSYEYIWKPLENFAKRVEEDSEGRVKINMFHSGQLYDGYEEMAALSRGDIDLTSFNDLYASGALPALNVFTMPFLFDDVKHVQATVEKGILEIDLLQELHDKHDIVVIGTAPWEPYQFFMRDKPLKTADDFKGKIWATTGAIDASAIQLLGGSPTNMSSADLYLSFDRGMIDGTPRPLLTGIGRSLDEVAEHLSIGNFGYAVTFLAVNRQKWESLPEDVQEILQNAAAERDREQVERVERFVEEAIAKFESDGMQVHYIDAENLAEMRARTVSAIDEWAASIPNGDQYLELIEQTRTSK